LKIIFFQKNPENLLFVQKKIALLLYLATKKNSIKHVMRLDISHQTSQVIHFLRSLLRFETWSDKIFYLDHSFKSLYRLEWSTKIVSEKFSITIFQLKSYEKNYLKYF
jgi:hypothetical protein